MHASNAARYEQSFRNIADIIKIAGRQDPQANTFELVHDWLRGCEHRWLVVLDNVDKARFLVDCPAADPKTGAKLGRCASIYPAAIAARSLSRRATDRRR